MGEAAAGVTTGLWGASGEFRYVCHFCRVLIVVWGGGYGGGFYLLKYSFCCVPCPFRTFTHCHTSSIPSNSHNPQNTQNKQAPPGGLKPDALSTAVSLLKGAQKPLLVVGKGAAYGRAEGEYVVVVWYLSGGGVVCGCRL